MFKNYLKIALRSVRRQKAYAFINIAGLALGMACCILIVSFIATELSYDRFHKNANRIYRLGIDASLGGNQILMPISNSPAAPTMVEDYPEVLAAVRIRPLGKVSMKDRDLEWADAMFTSSMIVQKDSLESIIARANRLNTPVVAGGPFPTQYYDQIKGVDHFVLGEAESGAVDAFIRDFEKGQAKKAYSRFTIRTREAEKAIDEREFETLNAFFGDDADIRLAIARPEMALSPVPSQPRPC